VFGKGVGRKKVESLENCSEWGRVALVRHQLIDRRWPTVRTVSGSTRFLLPDTVSLTCQMSSPTLVHGKPRKVVFDASYIAVVHTAFASTAFISALFLACLLHYKKVVRNGVAQWPDEWWPSVSATYVNCFIALFVT
jgi:hypothetical protein